MTHDGMKGINALERYECRIFEKLMGFFDELEVNYHVESQIVG